MRIAVAAENGKVAMHFGRCPEYLLFDVEDGQIQNERALANPGHEPGVLPRFLAEQGVECIIAGGMGPRAVGLFKARNIQVVTGAFGDARAVVEVYLKGTLQLGESTCEH
jgi:predicted Fe-Mo cluster-binding NifX family protein